MAAALVLCVAIVAAQGIRGIVLVVAIMLLATLPGTRAWKVSERALVRLTGSRRRAAVLVMAIVVGLTIAVNVYELVRS
jgi:hypothetical protein